MFIKSFLLLSSFVFLMIFGLTQTADARLWGSHSQNSKIQKGKNTKKQAKKKRKNTHKSAQRH